MQIIRLIMSIVKALFGTKTAETRTIDEDKTITLPIDSSKYEKLIADVMAATNIEELRVALSTLLNEGYKEVFPMQPRRTYIAETELTKRLLELAYKYNRHPDRIVQHLATVLEHDLENALGICTKTNDMEYEDMFHRSRRYFLSVPYYDAAKGDMVFP